MRRNRYQSVHLSAACLFRLGAACLVALMLTAPPALAGPLFEVGTFGLPDTTAPANQVFQPIAFQQAYDVAPLVFVVPTNEGSDPIALRIRNVTKSGFEVLHVEPSNLDGTHGAMTNLAYFAVVPGTWEIEPGVFLEAGSIDTSTTIAKAGGAWDTVTLNSFAAAPAIQTTIQSLNSETNAGLPVGPSVPWMTVATRNIGAGSFQVALEQAEVVDGGTVLAEKVGYVALTQAADAFDGNGGRYTVDGSGSVLFDAFISADNISGWTDQNPDGDGIAQAFTQPFPGAPLVVASMARRDGADGGWIRRAAVTATDVKLTVDEDTFADGERGHTPEAAGVFAFERGFYALVPAQEVFWDAGTEDVTTPVRPIPDDGSSPYAVALWRDNTGWRHDNSAQASPPNDVLPSYLDVVNIALEDNPVQAPVVIEAGDAFEVDSIRLGINAGLGVGGHGRLNITGGQLRVYDHTADGATATVGTAPQPARGSLNAGYDTRQGIITISDGTLDVENAVNLGVQANTTGRITQSGGAILAGTLNVSSGAGTGTVTISDGTLTTGELNLGNSQVGNFTQTGGTVTVNGDLNFGKIGNRGGTYHITDGSLTVTGQVLERVAGVDTANLYVDVDDVAVPGSFSVGGNITVQTFRLGQSAGQTGRWVLPDGKRIINTGTMFVGNNGTGELTVDDTAGTVGTPTIEVTNSLRMGAGEANANVGDGTLTFVQGVIDVSAGGVYLGGQDTAATKSNTTGEVVMGTSGGSLTGAQLFIRGGNLEVGRGGTGTFTQESGTVVVEANNLVLAQAADARGTYNIRGGQLDVGDMGTVNQDLNFNSGIAEFNQTGGTVNVERDLVLGSQNLAASRSTYNLDGGTLGVGRHLLVGKLGHGEFNYNSGTVSIGNSLLVGGNTGGAASRPNASGTINLGALGGSPVLNTNQFEVGRQNVGVVNQHGGTVNVNGANNLVLGQYAGSNGTYNMIGGQLNLGSGANGDLNFNAGTGLFNQTGGTVELAGGDVNLTNALSGDATYNLSGGDLRTGGGSIHYGAGIGRFNVQGGRAELGGGDVILAKPSQVFTLSSGSLNMGGGDIEVLRADGNQFVFSGGRLENLGEFRTPDLTVLDRSGSGHHGAGFNVGSGNVVAAKIGNGLQLDDPGDARSNRQYVALDMVFTEPNEVPTLSAAVWFNSSMNTGSADTNWAFIDFDRSDVFNMAVRPTNGTIVFSTAAAGGSGSHDMLSLSTGLNDGQWHHVAVVYDGTEKHIYVDGSLDNSTTTSPHGGAALGTGNDRYGIVGDGAEDGNFNGGRNNYYYDGTLDDLAVWARPLTGPEVTALYNSGTGAPADSIDDTGLILYTPLDDFPNALVQTGGTLAPGNSVGMSTISADYDLLGGRLEIEINGYDQGDQGLVGPAGDEVGYDFVDVAGSATLDSLLEAVLLDSFVPGAGDTFDVLTAAEGISLGDGFDLLTTGTMAPATFFTAEVIDLTGNAQSLRLTVGVPEPGTMLLLVLGGLLVALYGWRRRR